MTSIPTGHAPGVVSHSSAPEPVGARDLSPLTALNFVLRNPRVFFVNPAIVALIVGALTFTLGHVKWETKASFMPQSAVKSAGSSIAEDFGVDIGGEDKQNSPTFYVTLLKSRTLISNLALNSYTVPQGKDTLKGNIIELYKIRGKTPALKRENAIKQLNKDVAATADIRTGIVTITVNARWASLSRAMSEKLLADVNDFNLRIRQSKGRSERDFVASQVAEARMELRQSEDMMQAFLLRNYQYLQDPRLVAEHDRIGREVGMRNLRYSTLAMKMDQAELEAVRATPVITILERPELPVKPTGRGTVLRTALTFVLLSVLGGLFLLARDYFRSREDAGAEDFVEFRSLWSDLLHRVRHFQTFRKKRVA